MTKEFCDKCKLEIKDRESMSISFFGRLSKDLLHRNLSFCGKCYVKVDKAISPFIPKIIKKEKVLV